MLTSENKLLKESIKKSSEEVKTQKNVTEPGKKFQAKREGILQSSEKYRKLAAQGQRFERDHLIS